jgi:hypothetical protein
MVAAGVTTGHEVRESWNKGEGAQVITIIRRGGLRNAGDRNRPERHSGTYYPKSDHWRARYGETVRRFTRRWIASAGGRGSEGGDLWAARPTWM